MPQRTWTLRRHASGFGTVVAVTGRIEEIDELASELADAGYFAFAAVPAGLVALRTVAMFDLVVMLASVNDEDRIVVRRCQPVERTIELASDDRLALLAAVRRRLSRPS
jgi:hypothetical protein